MKLTKLSNELLKYMLKCYSENSKGTFSFSEFKSLYPDLSDEFLSDALYLLQSDGFVKTLSADNVAYHTALLLDAIRNAEENTFLKKGYTVLKEIRSWL